MEEEINQDNEEELHDDGFHKSLLLCAIIIIVIVLAVVMFVKFLLLSQTELDYNTMKCIGNNSILIASKSCGACKDQIKRLGDNIDVFNIIYCGPGDDKLFCMVNNITAVPTWIINDKRYIGVQSINKLKELTNC